jgi:hypothetical protein
MHTLFPEATYGGPRNAVPPLPESGPGELGPVRLLRFSPAASDGTGRLRSAASAGAPHPVGARFAAGASRPLPPGRLGHDQLRPRVHRLGPAPAARCPGRPPNSPPPPRRTLSRSEYHTGPLILLDTGHATAALRLTERAPGRGRTAVLLDGGAEAPLAALHLDSPELRAGFAVHLAHVTAGRPRLAGRPIGPCQQAALSAAPGRDWIVHCLALGTTHSEEGTS